MRWGAIRFSIRPDRKTRLSAVHLNAAINSSVNGNPKDRSLGNRQRFLRRARDDLKRSIRDGIRRGKIADADSEQKVSVPKKGTDEPRFKEAKNSGRREHVLPGNKHFSPGDRLPKPGGGGGGPSGPSTHDSEDDFRFVLSREEVLDLFFEDLELPDMVKLNLKEILASRPRRAGFAAAGAPTHINVGRTMRNKAALANKVNRWADKDGARYEFYTAGRFVAFGRCDWSRLDLSADYGPMLATWVPDRQSNRSDIVEWTDAARPDYGGPADDDELIRRALGSKGGIAALGKPNSRPAFSRAP